MDLQLFNHLAFVQNYNIGPLPPDIRVIFTTIVALYELFVFFKFVKRLMREEKLDPDGAYQRTQFMDFPVFSVGRCPNPLSPSTDIIAVSGGGGGAEYGVPNRLELYGKNIKDLTRVSKRRATNLEMISSNILLGVVDDIKYNKQRNIFIGGNRRDCVVFRFNPVSQSAEFVYRWLTVPETDSTSKPQIQERCAISPDGSIVVTVGEDHILRLFHLKYDETGTVHDHVHITSITKLIQSGCTDLSFTPDGNLLMCLCRDGNMHVVGPFDSSLSHSSESEGFGSNADLIKSVKLPVPAGVSLPRFSGPNPTVTLRNLQWLAPLPQSTVLNGNYQCVVSGYVPNSKTSLLFKLNIYSRFPPDGTEGEAVVDVGEIDKVIVRQCAMLNSLAISDDFNTVAAVSNARLYLYESKTFRNTLTIPRSILAESDLPATGCTFINEGREIVIVAGDFSVTNIVIDEAKRVQGCLVSHLLWSCFTGILKLLLVIVIAATLAVAISGVKHGCTSTGATDVEGFILSAPRAKIHEVPSEPVMPPPKISPHVKKVPKEAAPQLPQTGPRIRHDEL